MASKKLFKWPLPFGDECDPRCEYDLHNGWCCLFPVVFVVLTLALIGFSRGFFTYEFLGRCSLSYQKTMAVLLALLWIFFGVTWKYQKKITTFFWCRRCREKGGPVCPRCGGRVRVQKDYIFYSFLPLTVCGVEIRKCEKCGYELN